MGERYGAGLFWLLRLIYFCLMALINLLVSVAWPDILCLIRSLLMPVPKREKCVSRWKNAAMVMIFLYVALCANGYLYDIFDRLAGLSPWILLAPLLWHIAALWRSLASLRQAAASSPKNQLRLPQEREEAACGGKKNNDR